MLNGEKKRLLTAYFLFIVLWFFGLWLYGGFQGADGSGYIVFSRDISSGIKEIFQSHRIFHLFLLSLFPYVFVNLYSLLFSLILIFSLLVIRKDLGYKEDLFFLISIISIPIFLVMSPLVYTEIPSLGLSLLALHLFWERKYFKSGILFAISLFFKETALFLFSAIFTVEFFKSLKNSYRNFLKKLIVFSGGFVIIFFPVVLSYFIYTKKIWLISFVLSSEAIYSKFFSLFYDYIIRRVVFLSLLGVVGILSIWKLKENLKDSKKLVIIVYSFYMFVVYFYFHAVSPRFVLLFLPVITLAEFPKSSKIRKILWFVFALQIILSLFAIYYFSIPFRIETQAKNYVIENYEKTSVNGFSFIILYELEKMGYKIDKKNPEILFTAKGKIPGNYRMKKEFVIPCTMRIFRMIPCSSKVYVIAKKIS